MIDNMIYAPVRIHTLNRYDHFKACYESLEKCTGAENTEVFIGIDYPPSDKYIDGWKKITAFMKNKEQQSPFKKLHVYYRDHNCGIGHLGSNAGLLQQELDKRGYDRWISSEDDNVFSPNFLEYINKGLTKFEDDLSVFAICGYRHPYSLKYGNNTFMHYNIEKSSWGYGIWRNRIEKFETDCRENNIFQNTISLENILKISHYGLYNLRQYIYMSTSYSLKKAFLTDALMSAYLQLKGMTTVIPVVSKVRNIGWDELGNSFRKGMSKKNKVIAEIHNSQSIDEEINFEYIGEGFEFFDDNIEITKKESDGKISIITFLKDLIYILTRTLGKRFLIFFHLYKY